MHSISATEFKATCLELFDRVQAGQIEEIEVTKRGRVVAIVRPPRVTREEAESLFGCMEGTLGVPDDLNLTAPVFEGEINAESGRIHE